MRRQVHGLNETTSGPGSDVPEGVYLVRVERAQFHWNFRKPFYTLRLTVLEPRDLAGRTVCGRLDCTSKAIWKLGWFLRDFLYDPELLSRDEVDEQSIAGLQGVVKLSHSTIHGKAVLSFDGFAPASQWEALSTSSLAAGTKPEVA
jgi:hypothetical protein